MPKKKLFQKSFKKKFSGSIKVKEKLEKELIVTVRLFELFFC